MSEILFVTKPMAPPWTDGTKTLVRDLAQSLTRHTPVVLGMRGEPLVLPRGRVEPTFARRSVTVGSASAVRLAARLASGRRGDLWHCVFTPTPQTSRTMRALARLRHVKVLQTVPSLPSSTALASLAFGDVVVVLSRATERAFLDAGVATSRLRRIPPCVAPLRWTRELADRGRAVHGLPPSAPVIVFPGDIERGAREMIDAFAAVPQELGAVLVMATRRKTPRSADLERALRSRAQDLGASGSIRWIGETPHMHALLAAAEVVALPARDLHAKVDLPIVLLEAMSLGRAVVVAAESSAAELASSGAVATSIASLPTALAQLIQDTSGRAALGARAAAADYGPETMARAYEALYDELLHG